MPLLGKLARALMWLDLAFLLIQQKMDMYGIPRDIALEMVKGDMRRMRLYDGD